MVHQALCGFLDNTTPSQTPLMGYPDVKDPGPMLYPPPEPTLLTPHHQTAHICNQSLRPLATSQSQSLFCAADRCVPSGLKRLPSEKMVLGCCIILPPSGATQLQISPFIFFLASSRRVCSGVPCHSCHCRGSDKIKDTVGWAVCNDLRSF